MKHKIISTLILLFTLNSNNYANQHISLNKISLEEFQEDVIKGGKVFNYHYFRHPYLHTGTTPEIRATFESFLKQNKYTLAPVTIDTDDWKFNQELLDNPQNKTVIIQEYIAHTRGKVVDWSQDPEPDNDPFIQTKSLILVDKTRNRTIPVEIYVSSESEQKANSGIVKLPVVIINHGYTVKNTEYSFLANSLAAQGYYVASIQHELESDPELPKTGDLFARRKPIWERGSQNILFVISELKKNPHLDLNKVILIGHSNGGDISMLFTSEHPELVLKTISLDSLRHPFPTENNIPILTLRANDTKADDNVLPESGATIIPLKNTKHIEMCDRGSEKTKEEINDLISKFLRF